MEVNDRLGEDRSGPRAADASSTLTLTPEEQAALEGARGPLVAKVMRTVVRYGEALGAERLARITAGGHFVITYALPGIGPSMEMLDELMDAGLRADLPFTLDPAPPLDAEEWHLTRGQAETLERMYVDQEAYMKRMLALGLRSSEACTCTPYLPQVGNVPVRGDVLAWSESACVAFANSVLGARSNRNGAIIDLLCNLVGRVPLSGLLTDEGRRAGHLIEVSGGSLPEPQLLGAIIGRRVIADVPYVVGLDRWLDPALDRRTQDYLHELGAAAATAGAVGLFHVEGITPEAVDLGRALLRADALRHRIEEVDLLEIEAGLPVLWDDPAAHPTKCMIGCPHLSLEQARDGAHHARRRPRGPPGVRTRRGPKHRPPRSGREPEPRVPDATLRRRALGWGGDHHQLVQTPLLHPRALLP